MDLEMLELKTKKLMYKFKPPCFKCPYKLGLVKTFVNPCPQCKENDHQAYEHFLREVPASYLDFSKKES